MVMMGIIMYRLSDVVDPAKKKSASTFKIKVLSALIIGILIYNFICLYIVSSSKLYAERNPPGLKALAILFHVVDIMFYVMVCDNYRPSPITLKDLIQDTILT